MPLYDLLCEDGHRYEALRPPDVRCEPCAVCGAQACRVYGYKAAELRESKEDTRGMARRFQEASAEMAERGYAGPDLWSIAKRRAQAFSRAGEKPVVRS